MEYMSVVKPQQQGSSATRALGRLAGFIAVGGSITSTYLLSGLGLPCPLRSLTGLQCPLCGGTRAAAALLRLDIGQAWSHNALVVAAMPVLGCCALAWAVAALGGPVLRPPAFLHPLDQRKIYLAVGTVAVLFMVVRNLS